MSFTLVGTVQQAQAGTNPVTSPIDTTGADLLLIFISDRAASAAGVPSDSKGNTYTGLTVRNNTTNARGRWFYATGTPTVGSGHTATDTGDFGTITFMAFSGAHATAPFDVENGAAADSSGATIQPGSITPNQNDSLVVVGLSEGNTPGGGGPTIDGGFSTPVYTTFNAGSSARGAAVSYLIQTTAAAANPTWTVSGVTEYATAIAAFKPAAGGDTTPPTLSSRAVNTAGDTLTATLSESGCTPSSGTGGFTLGGTSATVASWAISGTTLTLTLAGTVYLGETVTLSYDRAATTDDIADAASNFLANFTDASVTNNSTQVPPSPSGGSMFRSAVISRGRML